MARFRNYRIRLLLGVAVAIVSFSPYAADAFSVPKGVYRVAELETARKEAYEEKKPLLVIYTLADLKPT